MGVTGATSAMGPIGAADFNNACDGLANGGQLIIVADIRWHGINQASEGAKPHPSRQRSRSCLCHVDVRIHFHYADRTEHPNISHARLVA